MHRFVFDVVHDHWIWKVIDEKEKVTKRCKGNFAYYLEALEDAKAHGFAGTPYFMSAKGRIVAAAPLDTGSSLR